MVQVVGEYPAAPVEDPDAQRLASLKHRLLARRSRFTAPLFVFLRLCYSSIFVGLMLLIASPSMFIKIDLERRLAHISDLASSFFIPPSPSPASPSPPSPSPPSPSPPSPSPPSPSPPSPLLPPRTVAVAAGKTAQKALDDGLSPNAVIAAYSAAASATIAGHTPEQAAAAGKAAGKAAQKALDDSPSPDAAAAALLPSSLPPPSLPPPSLPAPPQAWFSRSGACRLGKGKGDFVRDSAPSYQACQHRCATVPSCVAFEWLALGHLKSCETHVARPTHTALVGGSTCTFKVLPPSLPPRPPSSPPPPLPPLPPPHALVRRLNAWFDLEQAAWLAPQGVQLDGVLLHVLEPEGNWQAASLHAPACSRLLRPPTV